MEPSFNSWTIIFLIAAMQGVFLSVLLFARRSQTNSLLGALILSFSMCMIYYVIFWTGYFRVLPWQLGAAQGLTFLFGPLTYFYLRSDRRSSYIQYWHFIPFALYVLHFMADAPPRLINGFVIAMVQVLHLAAYTTAIFLWLSQNKGYSNGALRQYRWRKKVAWAFTGYSASFLLYYVMVWTGLLQIEYDYMISLASSFFIYFIGYHGFQKQEVLKMNESTRYDRSALNESASHSIAKRLRELMEIEKIYLQSSLKLQDVADKLELQPHHISQVINEQEEKHFSDFINTYRIADAKRLLIGSDHKIIHVAYDTGFNNKASFNNAFKKHTGMSPSEYREFHAVPA
ncbi:MAG: AraC family transcriptional regulator [Ekhidna sp.]|uniref:helix-turn-helix domain-containing protein n=1 Tax=Ekhidna sp. TaxID=2608089 RepID=UPI0032EC06DC